MSEFTSDLLRVLDQRGYVHQMTDAEGLDALAHGGDRVAEVGAEGDVGGVHSLPLRSTSWAAGFLRRRRASTKTL